ANYEVQLPLPYGCILDDAGLFRWYNIPLIDISQIDAGSEVHEIHFGLCSSQKCTGFLYPFDMQYRFLSKKCGTKLVDPHIDLHHPKVGRQKHLVAAHGDVVDPFGGQYVLIVFNPWEV